MDNEQLLIMAMNKIEFAGDRDEDCWVWTGGKNTIGRPTMTKEVRVDGKRIVTTWYPQTVLYENFYNQKKPARYMDMTCGNKLCCNPAHMRPRTFDNRFWGKVEKSNDENGCWIWKGFLHKNGYGVINIDGKNQFVHRVSYQIAYNEEIPEDMMILHSCNNRACVNPAHLRIGTHEQNMKDMTEASRQARGCYNGNATLTEGQVLQIKEFISKGVPKKYIAMIFGTGFSTIKDIASGRTWSWLKG